MTPNGFITAGRQLLSLTRQTVAHHPKQVTAAIAALLLGGAGGAFAVATLGPDAATLPVREVVEAVEPVSVQIQSEALDAHNFNLFRTDVTRSSDTVQSLMARLGLNDPDAANFLRSDPLFRKWVLSKSGRTVSVEASDNHALIKLSVRWLNEQDPSTFQRLVIERAARGIFVSRQEIAPLTATTRLGSGTINTTLYAAMDEAGLPDEVANQLTEIFAGDVDFHRGLRKGDRFSVVYEALEADGEPMRYGRVVSAEVVNKGRVSQALWFQEPGRKGGYYNMAGQSLERAYLASPMQASRVTSGFAMRMHPLLNKWRQHLGVDYGAPHGAPVRSVGDGVVTAAGWQGGYGNVITVDHGRGDVTLYGHLSKMQVRTGQVVTRGQVIGNVGATGWATGPHLHFEFRVKGQHKDPIEVARASRALELPASSRVAFEKRATEMRKQLASIRRAVEASQVASSQ